MAHTLRAEGIAPDGSKAPRPYDKAPPLAPSKLEKLRKMMDPNAGYLERRLAQVPELYWIRKSLHDIIEAENTQTSYTMNKPWLTTIPGTNKNLAEVIATTKIGGSMCNNPARLRKEFSSGKAKALLKEKNCGAKPPGNPPTVTQRQVGKPRGPSFRDDVLSEDEMKKHWLDYYKTCLKQSFTIPLTKEQGKLNFVIAPVFMAWQPNDPLHLKSRPVMNHTGVNTVLQETMPKFKATGGSTQARKMAQRGDMVFAVDFIKGYSQVAVTFQTALQQCEAVPLDLFLTAYEAVFNKKPDMSNIHLVKIQRKEHVIFPKLVLAQGNCYAMHLFMQRTALIANDMSQKAGMRVVSQVDDLSIWTKGGPTASYVDLLVTIATTFYFGGLLHLTDEKADQLWPAVAVVFDGTLMCTTMFAVFVPLETATRHALDLKNVIQKFKEKIPVSLREFAKVTMQQQYHTTRNYPTAYQLPRLKEWLGAEHRRLCPTHGTLKCWDQPTRMPPPDTLSMMEKLTTIKEVGANMRKVGPTLFTITVDASDYAAGFEVYNHQTGKMLKGNIQMTAATLNDNANHHTHKELTTLIDVAHATVEKEDARMPGGELGRIHLRNDNISGVSNVNKPGKHSRMVDPQINFVKALYERNLFVTGSYISKYYMDVISTIDYDGRKDLHNGEFQLHPEALKKVLKRLNMTIDFDLFATRSTKQTENYASRYHEKLEDGAVLTNALIHDWASHPALKEKSLYAFPPPSLAEAAVEKLTEHPINLLLILPLWVEAKTYWEPLQGMIYSYVVIPPSINLYKHPHGKPIPRSKIPSWPLIALRFCASASKNGESPSKQCKPSSGTTKMGSTTPTGNLLNPSYATSETEALAALVTGQQN